MQDGSFITAQGAGVAMKVALAALQAGLHCNSRRLRSRTQKFQFFCSLLVTNSETTNKVRTQLALEPELDSSPPRMMR